MNVEALVSVIMPVYNGTLYIEEAINSVLNQSHGNLELIIINDGSTDSTEEIIKKKTDRRIKYLKQPNKGVGAARNLGLKSMTGDFFCFLDADDVMPVDSLKDRVDIFRRNPNLAFVTGGQIQKDSNLEKVILRQIPSFRGSPTRALVQLDPSCFINCGTWLIKVQKDYLYSFNESWTHCEDLAFFYSISKTGGELESTISIAQIYRRSNTSTMANLDGLKEGYRNFYKLVKDDRIVDQLSLTYLKLKIIKIMFLSYLQAKEFKKSFSTLIYFIFL